MTRPTVRTMPSMTQINALRKDYTVVSLFAGGGGSSTGYKMAGFSVLLANEFIPAACETYKANHPKTKLLSDDIRSITSARILKETGLTVGELDLLDGSPPCSPFSAAGSRDGGWGKVKKYSDSKQRVDDLFDEFLRLLKGLKPKTFVAENVTGLVKGPATGYFTHVIRSMKRIGYNVEARILDASLLGVPQARQRLIFVGVRKDLKLAPVHPEPYDSALTVREVLPHIEAIKRNSEMRYVPSDRPSFTITASDAITSETARFSCGGFVETSKGERRKYTLKELRVICAFPRDYVLLGTPEQQWERLGRAVPPLMHYNVGVALREHVLDVLYNKPSRKDVLWKN